MFLKKLFKKKDIQVEKIVDDESYVMMDGSMLSGDNTIGNNTYIGYNCMITSAKIGNYCSIANNVSIGMGEHKIHRVSTSSKFYSKPFETLTEKECKIGNDVWLGVNVVVRRGVTIGNGAIIGANSFVNCDVGDFEIFAGSPAKKIKSRFDKQQIDLINNSKWWTFNREKAREIIKNLEKTNLFEVDK